MAENIEDIDSIGIHLQKWLTISSYVAQKRSIQDFKSLQL